MASCIEKKHTAPIDDVSLLSEFQSQNVDSELISNLKWELKQNSGPKVLVCHDMEGGYIDDKFVDGTDNPDFYNFYHWAQIDVFVYFSHHLVTIPPLMWVETAHKNGVNVLGTFITEWEAGADNCCTMFESVESSIHYAKQLANIAATYNFDGWLINIENALSATGVDNIQVFLQCLTVEMKQANSCSSVIWYDAVTCDGTLAWQDCVTDYNSCFFGCCDGIFLNYCWKDWQLQLSMELSLDRLHDVYVGIDVWARGCVGKFECHISTEKILEYGFSVALFAPAWCYEQNKPNFPAFINDNNKFWNLLQATCSPKPLCQSLETVFTTNFNFGFGKKVYEYGFLLHLKPWFNLSKQDTPFINFTNSDSLYVNITSEDAFEGSTCLQIDFIASGKADKLICVDVSRKKCEVALVCKSVTGTKMSDVKLLISDKNGAQQSLIQQSNMFIGGNGWRMISFAAADVNINWIGLECGSRACSILVGQLSF